MIIEGVVTTLSLNNELNIAPMGPIVDESMSSLLLRPFKTSQTYQNLRIRPYGVFHVVDDVLLIARAALNLLTTTPGHFAAHQIPGYVLANCCRWYEFQITHFDDSRDRTELSAEIVHTGRVREMSGFNRGKFAALEATIVATRLHLIPEPEVRSTCQHLSVLIEKTGGPQESEAFLVVTNYIHEWYRRNSPPPA